MAEVSKPKPDNIQFLTFSLPLTKEQITNIYNEGASARWCPRWVRNESNEIVGYERESYDAWCE